MALDAQELYNAATASNVSKVRTLLLGKPNKRKGNREFTDCGREFSHRDDEEGERRCIALRISLFPYDMDGGKRNDLDSLPPSHDAQSSYPLANEHIVKESPHVILRALLLLPPLLDIPWKTCESAIRNVHAMRWDARLAAESLAEIRFFLVACVKEEEQLRRRKCAKEAEEYESHRDCGVTHTNAQHSSGQRKATLASISRYREDCFFLWKRLKLLALAIIQPLLLAYPTDHCLINQSDKSTSLFVESDKSCNVHKNDNIMWPLALMTDILNAARRFEQIAMVRCSSNTCDTSEHASKKIYYDEINDESILDSIFNTLFPLESIGTSNEFTSMEDEALLRKETFSRSPGIGAPMLVSFLSVVADWQPFLQRRHWRMVKSRIRVCLDYSYDCSSIAERSDAQIASLRIPSRHYGSLMAKCLSLSTTVQSGDRTSVSLLSCDQKTLDAKTKQALNRGDECNMDNVHGQAEDDENSYKKHVIGLYSSFSQIDVCRWEEFIPRIYHVAALCSNREALASVEHELLSSRESTQLIRCKLLHRLLDYMASSLTCSSTFSGEHKGVKVAPAVSAKNCKEHIIPPAVHWLLTLTLLEAQEKSSNDADLSKRILSLLIGLPDDFPGLHEKEEGDSSSKPGDSERCISFENEAGEKQLAAVGPECVGSVYYVGKGECNMRDKVSDQSVQNFASHFSRLVFESIYFGVITGNGSGNVFENRAKRWIHAAFLILAQCGDCTHSALLLAKISVAVVFVEFNQMRSFIVSQIVERATRREPRAEVRHRFPYKSLCKILVSSAVCHLKVEKKSYVKPLAIDAVVDAFSPVARLVACPESDLLLCDRLSLVDALLPSESCRQLFISAIQLILDFEASGWRRRLGGVMKPMEWRCLAVYAVTRLLVRTYTDSTIKAGGERILRTIGAEFNDDVERRDEAERRCLHIACRCLLSDRSSVPKATRKYLRDRLLQAASEGGLSPFVILQLLRATLHRFLDFFTATNHHEFEGSVRKMNADGILQRDCAARPIEHNYRTTTCKIKFDPRKVLTFNNHKRKDLTFECVTLREDLPGLLQFLFALAHQVNKENCSRTSLSGRVFQAIVCRQRDGVFTIEEATDGEEISFLEACVVEVVDFVAKGWTVPRELDERGVTRCVELQERLRNSLKKSLQCETEPFNGSNMQHDGQVEKQDLDSVHLKAAASMHALKCVKLSLIDVILQFFLRSEPTKQQLADLSRDWVHFDSSELRPLLFFLSRVVLQRSKVEQSLGESTDGNTHIAPVTASNALIAAADYFCLSLKVLDCVGEKNWLIEKVANNYNLIEHAIKYQCSKILAVAEDYERVRSPDLAVDHFMPLIHVLWAFYCKIYVRSKGDKHYDENGKPTRSDVRQHSCGTAVRETKEEITRSLSQSLLAVSKLNSQQLFKSDKKFPVQSSKSLQDQNGIDAHSQEYTKQVKFTSVDDLNAIRQPIGVCCSIIYVLAKDLLSKTTVEVSDSGHLSLKYIVGCIIHSLDILRSFRSSLNNLEIEESIASCCDETSLHIWQFLCHNPINHADLLKCMLGLSISRLPLFSFQVRMLAQGGFVLTNDLACTALRQCLQQLRRWWKQKLDDRTWIPPTLSCDKELGSGTNEQLLFATAQASSWSCECAFSAIGALWSQVRDELMTQRAAHTFLNADEIISFASHRKRVFCDCMSLLCEFLDTVENQFGSEGTLCAELLSPQTKIRMCYCLDGVIRALRSSMDHLVLNHSTEAREHDIAQKKINCRTLESLICIYSFVHPIDSEYSNLPRRARLWYLAEKKRGLRSSNQRLSGRLLRTVTNIEKFERRLPNLISLFTSSAGAFSDYNAYVEEFVEEKERGQATFLQLRLFLESATKDSLKLSRDAAENRVNELEDSAASATENLKRKGVGLAFTRNVKVRRPHLRSRNEVIDEWLELDTNLRDGDIKEAFVDLEDFLVPG